MGWTLEELAEKSDMSWRHIQRLEGTKNPPPIKIDSLEKLGKAFKMTPSELIDFKA